MASGNTESLVQSLARLTGRIGSDVATARGEMQRADAIYARGNAQWEQKNGVSVEEQMMQLSRMQAAFSASSKVLGVVNEMLQRLVNL